MFCATSKDEPQYDPELPPPHDPVPEGAVPVPELVKVVDPRAPRIRSHLAVPLTAAAAVGIVTIAAEARGGPLSGWD